LLRNGVNIRVVQKILGHKSIETTARYLHVVNNDLQTAIEKFEDPFLLKENLQRFSKHLNTLCNLLSIKFHGPAEIGFIDKIENCKDMGNYYSSLQIGGNAFAN